MYNNSMYYNNYFPYHSPFKKNMFNLKGINWSNLLSNTQKTLNVINQAIPVYYQVKPIWTNAKTMFRMVGALRDNNNNNNNNIKESNTEDNKKNTSKGPVFFL